MAARDIEIRVPVGHPGIAIRDSQGELRGRIDLTTPTEPRDWEHELRCARAAHASADMMRAVLRELQSQERKPDHCVKPAQRAAAYAAGLEAGLSGESRVIGRDSQHNISGSVVAPEHKLSGPSYQRGWELGRAIWAAVSMAETGVDPRRVSATA